MTLLLAALLWFHTPRLVITYRIMYDFGSGYPQIIYADFHMADGEWPVGQEEK